MGGSKDEQQQIVRLEAVVTWCEALRDTTTGHAGLEQAIPATAANAAPAIRPALLRLTGQLRSKVPLDQALQDLAEQLNHSADLIIAALQMNVRTRGDGLVGVLTNLAVAGREELDLRRKITAGRAGDRRAVQLMLVIVLAVAAFLVLFSHTYTAPYRSVAGQVALAVVIGLFATSFAWIRKLAMAKPTTPFLPRAGQEVDPMEQRIIAALTAGPEVRPPASASPVGRCPMIGMVVVGARSVRVLFSLIVKIVPPKRSAIVELGQFYAHYRGSDTAAARERAPRLDRRGTDRCWVSAELASEASATRACATIWP